MSLSLWQTMGVLGLAVGLGMCLLWWRQYVTSNAGIVDVGWSFGLSAAAILLAATAPGDPWRRLAIGGVVLFWSLRLGVYLLVDRVLKHKEEDGRYARMRRAMGTWAQPGFFVFFQMQTVFVLIFALPLYAAAANPTAFGTWSDILGLLIAVGAIAGETVADRQLAAFRRDPDTRGTTCRRGLWRYSRHPNYFFEWLHWFAYLFLGLGSPLFWLAALGPLIIFVFIVKFTGIPYTEQQAESHRSDYAEYRRRTSMLIPWPPKEVD